MEMLLSAVSCKVCTVSDKIAEYSYKKSIHDTDGSYFSFAQCTAEQADTGAAFLLGDFIGNIWE